MTLNFAIAGTGGIANGGHGLALQHTTHGRLWSVYSRDKSRAFSFAQVHRAMSPSPAYDSYEELLADPELQAVIIATPDKLHRDQAILAARAGKHVLLEKPMATDVESAEAINAECIKNKVQLGIAYHLRWHAGHRALVAMAHSGALGELRHVRVQWSWKAIDAKNWRASEDLGRWWSLAGVGTHCLDLIRWTLVPKCGEVVDMSSTISRAHWGGPHDETAVLSFRFESGATAELCSSVMIDAPTRFEIYGGTGYAVCEGTLGRHGAGTITTGSGPLEFVVRNPFVEQIDHFAQSILNGSPPEVGGVEGAKNVALLVQALE